MCSKCENYNLSDFEIVDIIEEEMITLKDLMEEIKELKQIIKDERKHQELMRHELKDLETRIDIIKQQINSIK